MECKKSFIRCGLFVMVKPFEFYTDNTSMALSKTQLQGMTNSVLSVYPIAFFCRVFNTSGLGPVQRWREPSMCPSRWCLPLH